MKAILLTGGRGTRLRPLTHTKNKHALPIANKPLILYPFMNIVEAGIKEIGVIVNETRPEIEAILGNGEKWDVRITYIFQDHPGGLAHALSLCEDFIGEDKFIMVLGDNMLQNGFKKEVQAFAKSKANGHLLGVKVPLDMHKRLGMATVYDSHEVLVYLEKPGVVDKSDLYNPEKSYAVSGYYLADQNIFKCFHGKDAITPSVRGELEIPHAYKYLLSHGYKVTLSEVTGWWKDPGNPEDMFMTNRLVLSWRKDFKNEGKVSTSKIDDNVEIGKGSVIENSTIRGPVIIGKDVIIKDSFIGPYTSIGDGCQLQKVEIENSILLPNVKATNVPVILDSCLIGINTEISEHKETPRKMSLVIGDDARVVL
jgi:glucose-1-phosphate thymidylyltransferase